MGAYGVLGCIHFKREQEHLRIQISGWLLLIHGTLRAQTLILPGVHFCLACSRSFLLLVIDELDVVLGYLLVLFEQELLNFIADVALNNNLLAARRGLGDTRARGELLAKLLGDLLQLEVKGLEARDGRDVLALVPLDTLDDNGAGGALVGLLLLGGLRLGRFLKGVLLGPLLRFDREVGG